MAISVAAGALPTRSTWRVLLPLAAVGTTATYSAIVIAPLIGQIAAEFHVTPGAVGIVVAAYSLPGILVTAIVGPYSDRTGYGRILLIATIVAGAFTVLSALAPDFSLLAAARVIAGLGAAVMLPLSTVAAAEQFRYRERGFAMAMLFAGSTIGLLAGVAVAGIVGEQFGWRVSLALSGALTLLSALLLAVLPSRLARRPSVAEAAWRRYRRVLADRAAIALLISNFFGVAAWNTWLTFIVAFFERNFGLAQGMASTYGLVQGGGMLVGSQIGGRIGDRHGHRLIAGVALMLYGVFLLAATSLPLELAAVATLNFLAAVFFGMRATANAALTTELIPDARGTVLALMATTVSAATVAGTIAGGAIVDAFGFGALGAFCFGSALASAFIVLRLVREPASETLAPAD